jgi:hypothetical protein
VLAASFLTDELQYFPDMTTQLATEQVNLKSARAVLAEVTVNMRWKCDLSAKIFNERSGHISQHTEATLNASNAHEFPQMTTVHIKSIRLACEISKKHTQYERQDTIEIRTSNAEPEVTYSERAAGSQAAYLAKS